MRMTLGWQKLKDRGNKELSKLLALFKPVARLCLLLALPSPRKELQSTLLTDFIT